MNGGHVPNPKEDAFSKTIHDCYDKCEILQAEKCGLAEKASVVLERQIKRLDVGLRGLTQTEQFPADWGGPNLLNGGSTATGANTPAALAAAASASGLPLQAVSGNIGSTGGAPNFANAAQLRLAQNAANGIRGATSGGATPTTAPRNQREGSSEANKRRRLNGSLSVLPATSSHLRQSSIGPGTPKAGTPIPASSRAGSAQPTRPAALQKKAAPATLRKAAPPTSKKSARSRPSGHKKSSDRRRQLARDRATPSTNASLSDDSDAESTSPTPSSMPQADGSGERADEDENDDETLYCLCNKVSYGDMVGCDNDNCERQWFHYKCVGLSEEPAGEWLCPECKSLPRNKIKITKG
jgi:inhibitor of growth protein 3